jgi:hypothetical protein
VSASNLSGAVAAATCAPVEITSATLTVSDVKQRTIALHDVSGTNTIAGADEVTLTAVEVGALANARAINFADGAIAGAVVNGTTGAITYTDTFKSGALTQAQFITNFNASPAGAYFVASLNTGGVGTVVFGDTAVVALDTEGSSDYTVVVTFNQAVEAGAGGVPTVMPTLSSNQSLSIAGTITTTNAVTLVGAWVAATTTLTFLINDQASVDNLSTGSIKFAAAALQGGTTLVDSVALVGAL